MSSELHHPFEVDRSFFYPRIWQAIFLLVIGVVLQIALSIPVHLLGFADRHPAIEATVSAVAFSLVIAFGFSKTRAPCGAVFPLERVQAGLWAPLAITLMGFSIVMSEWDNLFRRLLPPPQWLEEIFERLATGRVSLWGSFLALVVVAPLTEEFLFRGIILRGFLRNYRVRTAVIGSALLFGLFHLNPWQFVPAFFAGLLLAWLFIGTRSLVPCLFAHALNNSLPLLISSLGVSIPGYTAPSDHAPQFQPFWLDALGLLLLAVGLWRLRRRICAISEIPPTIIEAPPIITENSSKFEDVPQ